MKQVDFDVRVFNLSSSGAEDGTQTRAFMLQFVKENYPTDDGWKVESVSTAGAAGGAISIVMFLARYADSTVSSKTK
jgi:hypothetical protein